MAVERVVEGLPPVKIGRNYRIDALDAADLLFGPEEVLLEGLTEKGKQKGEDENISGFIDRVADGFKNYHTRPPL